MQTVIARKTPAIASRMFAQAQFALDRSDFEGVRELLADLEWECFEYRDAMFWMRRIDWLRQQLELAEHRIH